MTNADDRDELRKLLEGMNQVSNLSPRERGQRRVDRVINRRPGLLREAARKTLTRGVSL